MRIELPQGVNPEHFAATYAFQEDAAVFEYGGTSFTKLDFERVLTELEEDPSIRLLSYAIEGEERVVLRDEVWE